jgi:hypothetical protein
MKNKLYIFLLSILLFIKAIGQTEHIMYNMDFVPQSQFSNPASKPKTKFHFGLEGYSASSWPLSYNQIVSKKTNDTVYLDAKNILNNLKDNNLFQSGIIPSFTIGFGVKKGYFMAGLKENILGNVSFPKDLFQILIKGNGDENSLGKVLNIGNFNINAMHYREYFIGGSYQIKPKWSVGLRLKYLVGLENVYTQKSNISITTDSSTYKYTLVGDYALRTSGLTQSHLDKYKESPFFSTSNTGFGVDAGAIYQYNKKIKFSAAVNDLGFISWKENNKIIQNKNSNITYEFSGLDLYNLASNNTSNYLENILDSIKDRFDFKDTATTENYTTWLNSRIILGGQYELTKQIKVGGLFATEFSNGIVLPSLSIFGQFDIYKIIQVQLNYQINRNSNTNLGLGTAINLGPLQYFIASDNIIGTAFSPLNSKNISIRTGINFQWSYGKDKSIPLKELKKINPIDTIEKITPSPIKKINTVIDSLGLKSKNRQEKIQINQSTSATIIDSYPNTLVDDSNFGCPANVDITIRSIFNFVKQTAQLGTYYQKIVLSKLVEQLKKAETTNALTPTNTYFYYFTII